MHSTVKRQIEMLEGVPPFAHQPGITLNAEATALVTSIEATLTSLNTLAGNQVSGGAEFHAGTDAKEMYVEQMLVYLRGMSKIARELPQETYPGVREKFRLPRLQRSYLAYVATARSFVSEAGPMKATFVANGLPADFDEKLSEFATELENAIVDQTSGRTTQVGSTAGLEAKAREGVKLVRRLDGIFSFQFRNDPVLLAEWQSVSHVDLPPRRQEEDEETPADPPASLATLVPSALNGHYGQAEGGTPSVVEPGPWNQWSDGRLMPAPTETWPARGLVDVAGQIDVGIAKTRPVRSTTAGRVNLLGSGAEDRGGGGE